MSQSRWCHSQGGVTVKVVSQARWCHSQGGVTVKVVSQSSGGCPDPKFRLFQSSDFPKSGSARFGGNQLLDGSINRSPHIPVYDERCARQYRYEPLSEFPKTSPFTGIVHHLSETVHRQNIYSIWGQMFIGVTNVHRQTNVHPQGKCSPVGYMFIGRTNAQVCTYVCVWIVISNNNK